MQHSGRGSRESGIKGENPFPDHITSAAARECRQGNGDTDICLGLHSRSNDKGGNCYTAVLQWIGKTANWGVREVLYLQCLISKRAAEMVAYVISHY